MVEQNRDIRTAWFVSTDGGTVQRWRGADSAGVQCKFIIYSKTFCTFRIHCNKLYALVAI